jgi:hypothetical protein
MVLLNGVQVASYSFNGDVVDGGLGLLVRSGTASYDSTRVLVGTEVINAVDSTPPVLTVPANLVRANDLGKTTAFVSDATIGTATATDNVPGVTVSHSGVPAGNIFPMGVTTITWTALDVFGNTTVKTQTVTVADTVKPTIVLPPNVSRSIPASQSSIVVTDAELGTASASDNSGWVTLTRSGVPVGNVFKPGTTTITYTAVDGSGNTMVATQTVTVLYPAIVLTAGPNQSALEGSTVTFNLGSFSGGGGSWTATVNWGDGQTSILATAPGAMSGIHTYANDRSTPYTVSVTVTDASGQSRAASFAVTVANVAPSARINTPGSGSNLAVKTSYAFKASFTDAGKLDTHTCSITWGDGTSSTGSVSESGGSGTCVSSHSYSYVGNYTITVKVTDNYGASTTATSAITVSTSGGTILTLFSVKSPTSKKAVKKVAAKTIHKAKGKAKAKKPKRG